MLAGSLAQKPRRGGHTWVFLQYLLGFQQLGWDVLFLDRLEPEMCVDCNGERCSFEESLNLQYFLEVMRFAQLDGAFSLEYNGGECCMGLSRREVLNRVGKSSSLLNVMGFLKDEETLGCASQRVFLDIDPGFGHMWQDLGLADLFSGYDHYVTIGENIGRADCSIPTCGHDWITTPQPVVLDHWPSNGKAGGGQEFTSVGAWRGSYGPLEYQGKVYGVRAHEFRKFAQLPRLTGQPFQVALDIHEAEKSDLAMLKDNGWSLADPIMVAGDPWTYRDYIQNSKAEIMVAKNMYVESNSGWFSDRSICYLASGKPVLVQDTGLAGLYPSHEGIITFRTLEEAVAGVEEISANFDHHARAARAIAEEHFDSDKVLTSLLAKLSLA